MVDVVVNYWAVLVAALSSMVVGGLVYGPFLGKKWLDLMGKKKEDMDPKEGRKPMAFAFLFALLQAYVLAHIVEYVGADTVVTGMKAGAWMWLGFVVTAMVTNNLFEQRKWGLVKIFLVNSLATMLAMGAIIAAWA